MELLVACAIGLLTMVGVYLVLRRHSFPVIIGTVFLSYAVNLFLFAMGRLEIDKPPIAAAEAVAMTDPLPQALVLTAIVIGFAFVCFALVLSMALLAKRPEGDVDRLADAEPGAGPDGKPLPFDAERRA